MGADVQRTHGEGSRAWREHIKWGDQRTMKVKREAAGCNAKDDRH